MELASIDCSVLYLTLKVSERGNFNYVPIYRYILSSLDEFLGTKHLHSDYCTIL